jgi:hypothetical protein
MKFECPHCQQPIEADDACAGMATNCPTCNGNIVVPLEIAVITTRDIADGKAAAVYATRDSLGLQFLDAEEIEGREPVAIAKADLLKLDPSLAGVTDLPIGWHAWRESAGSPWERAPERRALARLEAEPPDRAAQERGAPEQRDSQDEQEDLLSPEADQFLAAACAEYDGKQEALEKGEWRLESCAEWGVDTTGTVTVRFEDGSEWQADGQFLGSFNPGDNTFQWAWDSPDTSEQLARDSRLIKKIGERLGLRYLVMGGGCFPLPGPEFVDYLCRIALKATESIGVMEAQAEGMVGFIMLKNPRWTHGRA